MKIKYIKESYFKDVTTSQKKKTSDEVMNSVSNTAVKLYNIDRVKKFLIKNSRAWPAERMKQLLSDETRKKFQYNLEWKKFEGSSYLLRYEKNNYKSDRLAYIELYTGTTVEGNPGDDHLTIKLPFSTHLAHHQIYNIFNAEELFNKFVVYYHAEEESTSLLETIDKYWKELQNENSELEKSYKKIKPGTLIGFAEASYKSKKGEIIATAHFINLLKNWITKNNLSLDNDFRTIENDKILIDLSLTPDEKASLKEDVIMLKKHIENKYNVPVDIQYVCILEPRYSDGSKKLSSIKQIVERKEYILASSGV